MLAEPVQLVTLGYWIVLPKNFVIPFNRIVFLSSEGGGNRNNR